MKTARMDIIVPRITQESPIIINAGMAYVVFFVQVHSIINIAGNSMVKRFYFQKKKKHFF